MRGTCRLGSTENPFPCPGEASEEVRSTALVGSDGLDWSDVPVSDLCGTEIEWSVIATHLRYQNKVKKPCLLCGHNITGGPRDIRQHLDASIKPRHVSTAS